MKEHRRDVAVAVDSNVDSNVPEQDEEGEEKPLLGFSI